MKESKGAAVTGDYSACLIVIVIGITPNTRRSSCSLVLTDTKYATFEQISLHAMTVNCEKDPSVFLTEVSVNIITPRYLEIRPLSAQYNT